jgi:phosphoesterase RecJ-like protein
MHDALAHVAELLADAGAIVVCGHVDPDGDAVGSVLALTLALRAKGLDVTPTLADEGDAPESYAFLPGFELFEPAASLAAPSVFVALDTPTPARLGAALPLAQAADSRVVIDHHPDSACFLGATCAIDATSPATGALIWDLLPELGVAPDADIATCLWAALVTDTGRFQFSNTDAGTMRRAAEMLDAGARAREVYGRVYESQSRGALVLVGRTLSRIREANGGAVAYSWIDQADLDDTGTRLSETETLIDQVRSLAGVDAVFLVKTTDGRCKVSLRSKSEADVGAVARAMGGGGHAKAAGFTFEGPMEAMLERLLPMLPTR